MPGELIQKSLHGNYGIIIFFLHGIIEAKLKHQIIRRHLLIHAFQQLQYFFRIKLGDGCFYLLRYGKLLRL